MFTLSHLSDLHLTPPILPQRRALWNKRLLSHWSWTRKRVHIHSMHVLDALRADLHDLRPDHVVLTGDLVNLALPDEFAAAAAWLRGLGPPEWVTVVPGNHDALVPVAWRESLVHWADYMTGDEALTAEAPRFPILRRRGALALIGLSSAQPTAPLLSRGRLGSAQIERLEAHLTALGRQGMCRVVLLHHAPLPETEPWRKRLADGGRLVEALRRAGVELVLHGHVHRFVLHRLETASGPAALIGVPSASAHGAHARHPAHHHVYHVERAGADWSIVMEVRRFDPERGGFVAASRRMLRGFADINK